MLIELLLRRGDWKLTSKDFGGALQDAQRVLDIDERVAEAHRLRGDAFVAAGYKEEATKEYKRAIELDTGNSDAISGLVSVIEESNLPEALEHLESKRKFAGLLSEDYAHLAKLQDSIGRHKDALGNIAIAIERAPWDLTLYAARRTYEINGKQTPLIADLHYAQGLHEVAEYSARTGADERALRAFTEAFRTVVRVDEDEAAKLELAILTRDFSNFLVRRLCDGDAVRWWRSFAKNPLASKREQRIAAQEAQRVESKK